jgi:hypothetical protein
VGHHDQNFNVERVLQHKDMEGVSAGREVPFLCLRGKFFTTFNKDDLLNPVRYITSQFIKIHCDMNLIIPEISEGK